MFWNRISEGQRPNVEEVHILFSESTEIEVREEIGYLSLIYQPNNCLFGSESRVDVPRWSRVFGSSSTVSVLESLSVNQSVDTERVTGEPDRQDAGPL